MPPDATQEMRVFVQSQGGRVCVRYQVPVWLSAQDAGEEAEINRRTLVGFVPAIISSISVAVGLLLLGIIRRKNKRESCLEWDRGIQQNDK